MHRPAPNHDQHSSNPPARGGSDILVDWATLWRNKKTILACVAGACLLGIVYLALQTPVYEAQARLLVQNKDLLKDNRHGRVDRQFWETQAEIIRSPITLRRALERVPLPVPEGDDPLEKLIESLSVSTLADASVVTIGFRDTDPQRTTGMIEAIIDSYRQYLGRTEHEELSETIRLLTEREKELMAQLEKLQDEHRRLRAESPVLGQGKDALAVQLATLKRLGDSIDQTRTRRLELQSKATGTLRRDGLTERPADVGQLVPTALPDFDNPNDDLSPALAAIPNSLEFADPLPAITNRGQRDFDPTLGDPAAMHAELRDARSRENELGRKLGPKHPNLLALQERIEYLERQLARSRSAAEQIAAQELEAAAKTERVLSEMYDRELKEAKRLDAFLLEEQQLLERITRVEETHRATLASRDEVRLTEQAVASGRGSIFIEVLESPQLSEDLVWPKPGPFLAVCFFFGLVGGALLVIFRENRHRLAPATNSRKPVFHPPHE